MTQRKMKEAPGEGPDGGWGWVLVSALFVCNGLIFGLMRVFGLFFVEFVQYFDESAQAISWISSIGVAMQQFFSPLGAALGNAFGARVVVMTGGFLAGLGLILASQATCLLHLYLTMGAISGLGWGLIFSPMTATVMAYFTHRRSLALGIALSSIGLFAFAFNPLFQLLIEMYAWRGALLISGGLSFNFIPCGALIPPKKSAVTAERTDSESNKSQPLLQRLSSYFELSVLFERPFITYAIAVSLINVGFFVPYFHLVAHSRQVGFSEYQAAFVMSMTGATDILGRIASGWFSDLGHFRLIHLLAFWSAVTGVSILLLPVSSLSASYPALVMFSLVYGLFSGGVTSLIFSGLPQIVGVGRVMGAIGLLQMIGSGGVLLGTPLSGFLRDLTGTYVASFVVAGSFLILGSLTLATRPDFFSCGDPPAPPSPSKQGLPHENRIDCLCDL